MTLSQSITDLTSLVDAKLNDIITSRDVPLYSMMSYHMGWESGGGFSDAPTIKERSHGVLCLLSAAAAGGDVNRAVPAAAAVELVYNFTLIHDDVQGGNPQRDNRDAIWWKWGPAQAINAGDGMHALARLALFGLLESGLSEETTFRAVQIMDETSLKACEGRFLDLEAQERIDLSVQSYINMAESKTGALLACAMKLGALAGSEDESLIEAFGDCAYMLGVAMQIRSDIRELWGEDDGEPVSHEVMNKKKLLPVVYALEKADVSEKRRLGEIYFKRILDANDVAKVRAVLEELGVKGDCERLAQRYRSDALARLDLKSVSEEGKSGLEKYVDSLLGNLS